ncbi:hypothetical protein [Yokenella regensburgei]|uniref:hypothetical protein n=1 Tax=Yokenella regensburgei TaxID=158877 RepID=UPI0014333A95|nr:hypothetical protein [Yokenella regensburgei]QIU88528.1 hypothetical protein HEC60_03815 [Yokenella regensburgei]
MKKVWLVIFCVVSGCDENMSEDSASISGKSSMDSFTTLQSVIISDIDTYKRERGIFSLWDHTNTEYVNMLSNCNIFPTSTGTESSPSLEVCYSKNIPRRQG